jgi:adenylate cyclase
MGDSINTASRIQELNKVVGTRLLVTDTVIQQLSDWVYRRLCSFQPKGKTEILRVFEIFGPHSSTTRGANELCSRFDAAVASLESRDWAGARQMFEDLLAAFPGDGPCRFYLERCRRYLESPPLEDEQTMIRSNGVRVGS